MDVSKSTFSLLSFVDKKGQRLAAALVLAVLLSGWIYSIFLGAELVYLDEQHYHAIALNLAHDGTFSLDGSTVTAFRPPGYPILMAAFVMLGASVVHLRMLNFIALALAAALLYNITTRQAGPVAGMLGVGMVIGYPVLFYTAGTLYPQTIAALGLLAVVTLLSEPGRLDMLKSGITGLVLGALILAVPSFLWMVPVLALWLLIHGLRRHLKHLILLGAVTLLVVGSWTARNYHVFDSFVLVSTNAGFNLLIGNSENTRPNAGANVDITPYVKKAEGLDEVAQDRFYQRSAINWIRNNKWEAAKLYVLKLLNHFNFRNELVTKSQAHYLQNIVMLISYGFILLTSVARLVAHRRFPVSRLERLLVTLYTWNALASAVFFTRIRFRLPYDYLLIILAAILLGKLVVWNAPQPASEL